jgi:predicted nucleic acid-binding protein
VAVVLDSSVLIDVLRGSLAAGEFIAGLGDRPSCSEVSRIEIIQGLRSSERRPAARLFSLVDWVPVDKAVARRAGELGRQWRHSHPGIDLADLAIAATAEEIGAQLVTLNLKHFPMFEGLRAPY